MKLYKSGQVIHLFMAAEDPKQMFEKYLEAHGRFTCRAREILDEIILRECVRKNRYVGSVSFKVKGLFSGTYSLDDFWLVYEGGYVEIIDDKPRGVKNTSGSISLPSKLMYAENLKEEYDKFEKEKGLVSVIKED